MDSLVIPWTNVLYVDQKLSFPPARCVSVSPRRRRDIPDIHDVQAIHDIHDIRDICRTHVRSNSFRWHVGMPRVR